MTAQGDAGKKKREPAPRETLVRYGAKSERPPPGSKAAAEREGKRGAGNIKARLLKQTAGGFAPGLDVQPLSAKPFS